VVLKEWGSFERMGGRNRIVFKNGINYRGFKYSCKKVVSHISNLKAHQKTATCLKVQKTFKLEEPKHFEELKNSKSKTLSCRLKN
jgi:hypothetical protein